MQLQATQTYLNYSLWRLFRKVHLWSMKSFRTRQLQPSDLQQGSVPNYKPKGSQSQQHTCVCIFGRDVLSFSRVLLKHSWRTWIRIRNYVVNENICEEPVQTFVSTQLRLPPPQIDLNSMACSLYCFMNFLCLCGVLQDGKIWKLVSRNVRTFG